jgi:hypothetical protein
MLAEQPIGETVLRRNGVSKKKDKFLPGTDLCKCGAMW